MLIESVQTMNFGVIRVLITTLKHLEVTMSKPTAVTLLFREFRALSEATRKAGDEQSANLIDFLCEREDVAKHFEKQQIGDAYRRGFISDDIKLADDYYTETFGGSE